MPRYLRRYRFWKKRLGWNDKRVKECWWIASLFIHACWRIFVSDGDIEGAMTTGGAYCHHPAGFQASRYFSPCDWVAGLLNSAAVVCGGTRQTELIDGLIELHSLHTKPPRPRVKGTNMSSLSTHRIPGNKLSYCEFAMSCCICPCTHVHAPHIRVQMCTAACRTERSDSINTSIFELAAFGRSPDRAAKTWHFLTAARIKDLTLTLEIADILLC